MRILILGAGGMIGHTHWRRLSGKYPDSTFAVLHSPKSEYARFGLFQNSDHVFDQVDLADATQRAHVLSSVRPDVILNCVGITYRRKEASWPIANIELNALLPHQLAVWAEKNSSRVIHFSTDCVFEGDRGDYTESDQPDGKSLYGRTKGLGEIQGPCSLTLRCSMIGRELHGKTEFLEWFLSNRGKQVMGFKKAIYSGITTPLMAEIVEDLIFNRPKLSGLYQLGSTPISKYDLLHLIRERFNLQIAIQPEENKGYKRNLIGDRFAIETGFQCPSWPTMIDALAKESAWYDQWT